MSPQRTSASSAVSLPPWAAEILAAWAEHFPYKIQPHRRMTSSAMRKLRTRWADPQFRAGWRAALERSADSYTLNTESWFQFEYFVRNDTNWQKMLSGWMDWKDAQHKRDAELFRKAKARRRAEDRGRALLRDYIDQAAHMDHESRCRLADKVHDELGRDAWHTFREALTRHNLGLL